MSSHRSVRRLLLTLAVASASLTITTATASAVGTWGELSRFGPGSGKTAIDTSFEAKALGVDQTTNTVYIGDQSGAAKYRIQEFNGATGESLGSATIAPQKEFTAEGLKGAPEGIEGVAVDAAHERVYVLAVYERGETTAAQEKNGEEVPDEGLPAAGVIYAFSTKPNAGKELVSATANPEGVLATPSMLKAQGETPGEALLEPAGITVDPTTGDVIILAEVDQGEETFHIALQRVTNTGIVGARYVDPTETGEEEAGATANSEPSNSPVVTKGGHVLVQQFNKIVQIPTSFAPSNPTLAYQMPPAEEQLLSLDALRSEAYLGGGLSLEAQSETSGTLFASVLVNLTGDTFHGGVLDLEYVDSGEKTTASEVGWTGGSSSALGPKCALSVEGPRPVIAAAKSGHVFVLDAQVNQAVEFGPAGTGCPVATAGPLATTVGGAPVSEVPAGTSVKLSAPVTQANVLGVEWDFGEGEAPLKLGGLGQSAETTHTFAKNEQLQPKATIRTDDLASEPIVVTKSLKVAPAAPTASFSAPTVATVGQSIELNASSSSDPNKVGSKPVPITKYAWKFGDGGEEVLSSPVAHHTYAAPNTYAVTLTVTDELGKSASKALSIPVSLPGSTPPPAPPSMTPGSPGGGSPVVTTKPTGTGTGGVLPFRAALAATSFTVSAAGAVVMKVACVLKSSCVGTLTLKTLSAVSASTKKGKKAILTLASGSFSAAGGQVKAVTLHLSAKARKLLARVHALKVRATIVARDARNVSHTTQTTVTLHAAKPKHH